MIGPRCIHCKKQRAHHRAGDLACPIGKRSRVLGYTQFTSHLRFEAKEPKTKQASEKRKDRDTRRAVKAGPCCACGTRGSDWNPVDPCHVRTFKVTQSDHPANMIPMCRECHKTQHRDGWLEFLSSNTNVSELLERMGWVIWTDPFEKGKLHMAHPDIP